jgi:hypothetical protein
MAASGAAFAKVHTRLSKVASGAVAALAEYAALDASGARVLASLHNLLARLALLTACAEGVRVQTDAGGVVTTSVSGGGAGRLLGSLALFHAAPAALAAKHAAEVAKAQRNLATVVAALQAVQAAVRQAAAEACALWDAWEEAGGAGLEDRSPERPVSAADLLALVRAAKAVVAADMTRKVEALAVAGGVVLEGARVAAGSGGGAEAGEEAWAPPPSAAAALQASVPDVQRVAEGWSGLAEGIEQGPLALLVWRLTGRPARQVVLGEPEGEDGGEEGAQATRGALSPAAAAALARRGQ